MHLVLLTGDENIVVPSAGVVNQMVVVFSNIPEDQLAVCASSNHDLGLVGMPLEASDVVGNSKDHLKFASFEILILEQMVLG